MSKLHKGLNTQVANLAVLFVKLHHHHWYVPGPNFYLLHEKFEEFYDEVNELYDAVAERLLMIGGKPFSKMKDYLANTTLVEAKGNETAVEMVESIANDFKTIRKEFNALIKVAQAEGDEVTTDLLLGAVTSLDKHIWMLEAFLSK
ncbi:MAG: DNA protection during starvation protein 1 [Tenericutes bacterium ADurb.Bin239]|nr:MAG: DNA protection during starvation protein 1 [Tenericutes bacterium ADurb.Bin239]